MITLSRSGGVTAAAAVVLLSMATTAGAQQGSAVITGKVTSDQGVPLPGANVYITELNVSVGTGSDGAFTIPVAAARASGQTVQLRVRSVGFQPQAKPVTLTAGSRQTVNFSLTQDALRLSEVVVTGVSAATEQVRVPFAVQRVDTTRMPVVGANAISQLQGKVPGASIVGAGRPGAAPTIVLRGVTSLNASGRSQQPLYILDGVLLQGGLPDINPADIENVEVVAGAAAASLYGPRAATGVINITTKKGRGGETGVRFGLRSELGAGDIEKRFPTSQYTFLAMDPSAQYFCTKETVGGSPCVRYIDMEMERKRVNDQPLDYALPPQGFLWDFGISATPNYGQLTGLYQATPWPKQYDPVGQLITPSASAITNLDARGSFASGTNFYASVSNLTQQGAVRYLDGYRRNAARLNLDQKLGDKFSMGMQTYYARLWSDGDNLDNTGSGGPWFNITRTPSFVDLTSRDALGRLYIRSNPLTQGDQNSNPAYPLVYQRQINTGGRFIGGVNGKYTATEWLTFNGSFGYDRSQTGYTYFRDRGYRTTSSNPTTASGYMDKYSSDVQSLNSQLSASARHTFFSDLEATLTASSLYSLRDNGDLEAQGQSLVVPGLYTLNAVTDGYTINSSVSQIREIGYLGNLNLAYKGRYIIDGAVRHDGSSLFGKDNRWQTFGRISGTWIASDEPWWPAPNALKLFKIRANYGKSGNSPAFSQQYETFTIGTGGTLNPSALGNKLLKPEVKTDVELGADLDIYGKAALALTWVNSTVDDQILPVKPPTASGFQTQWQNAGAIRNRTVEASLEVPIINKRNLTWSSRFIFDKTVSRITRLDVPPFTGDITAANTYTVYQFREGERIGTFYGTRFAQQCTDLPAAFVSQCGGAGSAFQRNDKGFIVWVGAGNSQAEGITKNLWTTALPAAQAPYGVRANWGMPIVLRDSATLNPQFASLGNGLPNAHFGLSQNFSYKKFGAYALVDAVQGNKVWNIAYLWSLGDFMSADEDQYGKSVETAKPIGYYWRRGPASVAGSSGIGGMYDVLNGPNSFSTEDGSYAKLRELSVNYRFGRIGGVGNWTVGVVGRNLYTLTHFRGWDPETGQPGGNLNNAALNSVAGYRFPNMRTFTLQLSSTF